jgi:CBS domain-containing protein
MLAKEIISDELIPLRTSDTGEEALGIMGDFYIRHLPIVNNRQLLGLLSEEDILNQDTEEPIGSYHLSFPGRYVREDAHLYEVMAHMAEFHLTVVPVVDSENNYSGLITLEDALHYFAKTAVFSEPGGIIVLEMSKRNYSLSEIARIVESENATILSAIVTTNPGSDQISLTLKLNRNDIQSVLATLERFEYHIKATFQEDHFAESLRDRYESLLNYLNV